MTFSANLIHKGEVIGTALECEVKEGKQLIAANVTFNQKKIVKYMGGNDSSPTQMSYIDFGMQPSAIHLMSDDEAFYGISISTFKEASGDERSLSIEKVVCEYQMRMKHADAAIVLGAVNPVWDDEII